MNWKTGFFGYIAEFSIDLRNLVRENDLFYLTNFVLLKILLHVVYVNFLFEIAYFVKSSNIFQLL